MKSMREELELEATNWIKNGRSDKVLFSEWRLFSAKCWLFSKGADHDGYSQAVKEFLTASEIALGEAWWDKYLYTQGACNCCGTRYKMENISICTGCLVAFCPNCANESSFSRHQNGNRQCTCGGEIVG